MLRNSDTFVGFCHYIKIWRRFWVSFPPGHLNTCQQVFFLLTDVFVFVDYPATKEGSEKAHAVADLRKALVVGHASPLPIITMPLTR